MCSTCLVEKMNNNQISTIQQTKDRIQSLKAQRQENRNKAIQVRLNYFKNILCQIMDQIKAQMFTIEKEQQNQSENYLISQNFKEDLKALSEFLSLEAEEKQMEIQQDSNLIDEIAKQFELLFNNAPYFQTIDTFKDAKSKINEINEDLKIELIPLNCKNTQKTQSLNKLCITHNKEIIMIDIDSKNKKIEDRFVCVDCISDHPLCQCGSIEKINIQLNQSKNLQDRILNEFKIKRSEKQEKLSQQIAIMRKNYNRQLNEIREKVILEFSSPLIKKNENNKIKKISIQQLSQDDLLQNINNLIQEKENLNQDLKIDYLKSKDNLFQKEIESRLEHLKQLNQLDIQESIKILWDVQNDNQIQDILLLQKQIQESTQVNQEQLNIKQELDGLINSSKQVYCQMSLFIQTIQKYQEHNSQIKTLNNKIKSIPDNTHLTNIQKQVQDYTQKFENDFKQFSEIEKLEKNLNTLQQDYNRLEIQSNQIIEEKRIQIENQNKTIDDLNKSIMVVESKLKNQDEQVQLLNKTLKPFEPILDLYTILFYLKIQKQKIYNNKESKKTTIFIFFFYFIFDLKICIFIHINCIHLIKSFQVKLRD